MTYRFEIWLLCVILNNDGNFEYGYYNVFLRFEGVPRLTLGWEVKSSSSSPGYRSITEITSGSIFLIKPFD